MKVKTFWIKTWVASIIVFIVAVWLAFLAGPFLLWRFVGGWGWFLLYIVTIPLFCSLPAIFQAYMNERRAGKNDKTA